MFGSIRTADTARFENITVIKIDTGATSPTLLSQSSDKMMTPATLEVLKRSC